MAFIAPVCWLVRSLIPGDRSDTGMRWPGFDPDPPPPDIRRKEASRRSVRTLPETGWVQIQAAKPAAGRRGRRQLMKEENRSSRSASISSNSLLDGVRVNRLTIGNQHVNPRALAPPHNHHNHSLTPVPVLGIRLTNHKMIRPEMKIIAKRTAII